MGSAKHGFNVEDLKTQSPLVTGFAYVLSVKGCGVWGVGIKRNPSHLFF